MKTTMTTVMAFVIVTMTAYAGGFATDCPTLEQQQAAYNQKMACSVRVTNTATQQLQTYYQQLATYYQQLDKDNQQKAKDAQQIAKDLQQIAFDKQLCERLAALNLQTTGYDELKTFLEVIIPKIGDCSPVLKTEFVRIHTNRSGGGDGTNPGGNGNINGFDNPGYIIAR